MTGRQRDIWTIVAAITLGLLGALLLAPFIVGWLS